MVVKLNKSFLIKLSKNIHIYDFFHNININKDKKNHISQKFLWSQMPFRLPLFKLNLEIGAFIIFICNVYLMLEKCNAI